MADWYARADLFVLPSRFEGFPNVLLEAMAAGCACVASDCPTGPSDLIRDNRNGRLLAHDASTDQWIEVLEPLLRDASQRSRFGQQAEAVRERFGENRLRSSFLPALEGLHRG